MTTPADEQAIVALTMTPDAAERFWTALIYAANRIPSEARRVTDGSMDHEDWLRWGASRLDAAYHAILAKTGKANT